LGKSVHHNRPGKKHNTGFGLPPIAVTNINKKKHSKAQNSAKLGMIRNKPLTPTHKDMLALD